MPTIKKINVGGVSYDIGGGLTEDVKQASLQIAEKVAYVDKHGQDYYDDLYTAFYDNMWNVTNTLSNASTSNSATKTAKDGTYTAIISANTGYTLDGATVSVTMGGANVTSAVYSNGVVNIQSVTGDVVITVVAVALTVVSISAVYTQSGTVYSTDTLDSLKDDLVVTATFSNSSTEVVPSEYYTLTGTLTAGTSTVTVEYGGQTATFDVTDVISAFLYTPSMGILSAQEGVSTTNLNYVTETLGDEYLRIYADRISTEPYIQFQFTGLTFTEYCYIKVVLKLASVISVSGSNFGTASPDFAATNGANRVSFGFVNVNSTQMKLRYISVTPATDVANLSANTEYTVEAIVQNNKATVLLNGETVVTNGNLGTTSASIIRMGMSTSKYGAIDVYIKNIEIRSY